MKKRSSDLFLFFKSGNFVQDPSLESELKQMTFIYFVQETTKSVLNAIQKAIDNACKRYQLPSIIFIKASTQCHHEQMQLYFKAPHLFLFCCLLNFGIVKFLFFLDFQSESYSVFIYTQRKGKCCFALLEWIFRLFIYSTTHTKIRFRLNQK